MDDVLVEAVLGEARHAVLTEEPASVGAIVAEQQLCSAIALQAPCSEQCVLDGEAATVRAQHRTGATPPARTRCCGRSVWAAR